MTAKIDKTYKAETFTTTNGTTYEIMHNPNWGYYVESWSDYADEIDEVRNWCECDSKQDQYHDHRLMDGFTYAQ